MDFVAKCKKWNLIHWCPEAFKNSLDDVESGTIVIWSVLDRIIPLNVDKMDQVAKERFSMALQKVREHIAMTFHRFIEDKQISIFGAVIQFYHGILFAPQNQNGNLFL